jgi:sugar-specific transcriptional regulator TrmB
MGSVTTSYPDDIKTLCNLGLTVQQAKIYLILAKEGAASVKEIAEKTKTDRAETYRVVGQLQKKCLIARELTLPNKYEAISVEEQIRGLLEKRKNDMLEAENGVIEFLKRIPEQLETRPPNEYITYVPMSASLLRKIDEIIVGTKTSIDIITCSSRALEGFLTESNKKAAERGIKIRDIIGNVIGDQIIPRWIKMSKYASVRTTSESIAAPLAIHDKKTLVLFISEDTGATKSSPIITNNRRMVKLAQDYFDNLWNNSEELIE